MLGYLISAVVGAIFMLAVVAYVYAGPFVDNDYRP